MWAKCLKLQIALRLKRAFTDSFVFLEYLQDFHTIQVPCPANQNRPQPPWQCAETQKWFVSEKNINSSKGPGVLTHHTIISYTLPRRLCRLGKAQHIPNVVCLVSLTKINSFFLQPQGPMQWGEFLGRWLTSSTCFAHVPEKHVNKPKCIFLIRGR